MLLRSTVFYLQNPSPGYLPYSNLSLTALFHRPNSTPTAEVQFIPIYVYLRLAQVLLSCVQY